LGPLPIIKATCAFDAKIDEFLVVPIHLSTYMEKNKKIFENSDFCSRVPALLVENPVDILPILTSETTLPPCLSLFSFQLISVVFSRKFLQYPCAERPN